MHRYTLEQLRMASTYAGDPALATLARRVAERQTELDLPLGERKRLALAGEMAEAVHAAMAAAITAEEAAAAAAAATVDAWARIALPGWTITLGTDEAALSGPRDEAVNASLRRHGRWDPVRRAWIVPIEKGPTLARSLRRGNSPAAEAKRSEAAAKAAETKARTQIERWLGYVEEAARQGRQYPRGVNECVALGIASYPDLQARLEQARHGTATRRAETERWLGFVEEAAREGRIYHRGLDECRKRQIATFPELQSRLDAALARVQAKAAEETTQRAAHREARELHPLTRAPAMGVPYRRRDRVIVFERAGKRFEIDDSHPSIEGSHLLGHEGEWGAYYYYRPATATEIADLERSEAAASEQAAAAAARRDAYQRLANALRVHENLMPPGSAMPEGDIVHDSRTHYGGGEVVLIGADGTVSLVIANGADGDDWSRNNLPGAIGWSSRDAGILELAKELQNAAIRQARLPTA